MAFTYFFRDLQTLEHITKYLVPSVTGRSAIRIWDAGCASGQEPYTLAILLAEAMGRFSFRNLQIEATDLDGSNLFGDIIAKGVYPKEEVERIPVTILQKYFTPCEEGIYFKIDEQLRNRLTFQKHDLLSLKPIGTEFSLILCKNVLLHLQGAERIAVIKMFYDALGTGGFLATEQTQKIPDEVSHLFIQVTPDAQLFRKNEKIS